MKKILALALITIVVSFMVIAGSIISDTAVAAPQETVQLFSISADPCLNPSAVKSSALISVGTNTTALVVAPTAGNTTYVCNVEAYLTGTTTLTTFELVSGTSTTTPCDTGAVSETGLHGVTSAVGLTKHMGSGGTLFRVASTDQLCSTTTGTSSAVTGVVTYVKQ